MRMPTAPRCSPNRSVQASINVSVFKRTVSDRVNGEEEGRVRYRRHHGLSGPRRVQEAPSRPPNRRSASPPLKQGPAIFGARSDLPAGFERSPYVGRTAWFARPQTVLRSPSRESTLEAAATLRVAVILAIHRSSLDQERIALISCGGVRGAFAVFVERQLLR